MSRTRFFGAHRTEKAERVAGLILTKNSGAPEEIRTPDPQIRSLVLYPAELRALLCQARTGKRGRGGRGIAKASVRRWQGFGSAGVRFDAGAGSAAPRNAWRDAGAPRCESLPQAVFA